MKKYGRGQELAVDAWRKHDSGSKNQSRGNLGSVGEGKELLYRHGVRR